MLGRPPHRAIEALGKGRGRGCRGLRHGGKLALQGGNCVFLGFQTCRDRLGALAVHSHSQEVFPCIHGPVTGILIVLDAIPALRWRLRWDRRRLVRALPGVLRAFSYPLLVTTQGIKRKRGEVRRSAGGVPEIKDYDAEF